MSDDEFTPLGESVPAMINRMITEANTKADIIWYAGSWGYFQKTFHAEQNVLLGINTGTNPDYQILVTDEAGSQTTYVSFEEAIRAVAWDNIRVSISRMRDQIEAFGRSLQHVDFSGLDWLLSQHRRLPVFDEPLRQPHHAHLIQRHIRSAKKPAKNVRNSRQIVVASIPHRQTRRHKRKVKKLEQS